jgi:hypothetical protein
MPFAMEVIHILIPGPRSTKERYPRPSQNSGIRARLF